MPRMMSTLILLEPAGHDNELSHWTGLAPTQNPSSVTI
ncbi:hypothetical protein CGRA01v4_04896 [Colletotrichum graminicola]|nr:hypothetical protein CGRA01v4_04896 [Colletotrichum graminicola]